MAGVTRKRNTSTRASIPPPCRALRWCT